MYGNLRFLLRVLKCMNSPKVRGTAAAAAGGYLGRELECLIRITRGAHKVQVHRVAILLHVLCGRQEQRGIVPAELHEQRAVLRVRVEVGISIVADRGGSRKQYRTVPRGGFEKSASASGSGGSGSDDRIPPVVRTTASVSGVTQGNKVACTPLRCLRCMGGAMTCFKQKDHPSRPIHAIASR